MKFTLLLLAALFVSNATASAQHIYLHYLHLQIINEYSPCADFRVELTDANGHAVGTYYYRLQRSQTTLGFFAKETLSKDLVPKITVFAGLGDGWNYPHRVCLGSSRQTVRSAPWQTAVYTPPDSLDLRPVKIELTANKKLIITLAE